MSTDQTDVVLSWTEQVHLKTFFPPIHSIQNDQPSRSRGLSSVSDVVARSIRRRGVSIARSQSGITTMSIHRKRKVTFKNMYTPDVVPPPKVESYDELVFNVAGLFHTTSFLHDPEDWGDEDPIEKSLASSDEDFCDPEPPLERSIPLMIAEFLYRSAIFLGYPQGDTPWLPGFRQDKKFSSNDVKRWRRLAHFDWEAEEKEFLKHHPPRLARTDSVESNGHTSVMSTIGTSFRLQNQQDSVDSDSSSRSQDSQVSGKMKFRSAVTGWVRKHQRQHTQEQDSTNDAAKHELESNNADETKRHGKHKPVSWLNPPPISSSRSLRLLVDIINSCIYCGQFQFRKRDIVRLCNVKI
ncbi:unnamed protein product [Peronospora belbahrii]|uniref:Uncharacterized protein n=1 Tax=Peronospora belbahrii TaxID=622444 RepID=A0AAU9KPN2_9STRA|nr:unnamed protein product [Peronospora belbahrii]CAH0521613.1 unnamed protein product [Peronospora belbahrii]